MDSGSGRSPRAHTRRSARRATAAARVAHGDGTTQGQVVHAWYDFLWENQPDGHTGPPEARRNAARADREGELRVPHPRSADDRRLRVRRAHARAPGPRGEAPRARDAGVADPTRRRAAIEPLRAGRARA